MTALPAAAAQVLARAEQALAGQDLLGIYLNDHLAGATFGTELARRAATSHHDPAAREALRDFAVEVAADRRDLIEIMSALGVPVRGYKVYAARIGQRAGKLKLNGRLRARSPLSDLEELEALRLGVEGKAAGWRTLRALAEQDGRLDTAMLDRLLERAGQQGATLEELRVRAAQHVIRHRRQDSHQLRWPLGGNRG